MPAFQFKFIDGINGHKTQELAKSLGLSQHGMSELWETETSFNGWKIVGHGDVVVVHQGIKEVLKEKEFLNIEDKYKRFNF